MGPRHRKLPPLPFMLASVFVLLASCLGDDFAATPLEVTKWDHGWLIAIEPEERFSVDLPGSSVYPDSEWSVTQFDSAVLRFENEGHEDIRLPSGAPESPEPEGYDPGSPVPRSWFDFSGVGLGETPLRFELTAEGEAINIAEYTVVVVDDACAADTAAVANRCGGDGFAYHPQMLHDRASGDTERIEIGGTARLVLTANALHQSVPWQIEEYDESVLTVSGPRLLGPARTPGDFGKVEFDTPHSFLPAWEFTISGVAAGESTVVFALEVDDWRIDAFEVRIIVAQD